MVLCCNSKAPLPAAGAKWSKPLSAAEFSCYRSDLSKNFRHYPHNSQTNWARDNACMKCWCFLLSLRLQNLEICLELTYICRYWEREMAIFFKVVVELEKRDLGVPWDATDQLQSCLSCVALVAKPFDLWSRMRRKPPLAPELFQILEKCVLQKNIIYGLNDDD